jgi:hypothetical protein
MVTSIQSRKPVIVRGDSEVLIVIASQIIPRMMISWDCECESGAIVSSI